MNTDDAAPTLKEVLGKTVIIGITKVNHDGKALSQEQHFGRIVRMDNAIHVELESGCDFTLPPDLSSFRRAKPGIYRLRSTGQQIENPDFTTTWTVHPPSPKSRKKVKKGPEFRRIRRSSPRPVSLENQPENEAERAFDDAKRLAQQGEYEAALRKRIWFHEHALEVDPSYYGVRLSYALSDWIDLGRKYPKALATLKRIRKKTASRLLAGETERDLFHDVKSIDRQLGEPEATVALFKKLEAAHPDFVPSISDLADEALMNVGEYGLVKKYLGDPEKHFKIAKRNFQEGTKCRRLNAQARQAYERIFTDEVVRLMTVLDKTGDRTLAREIQSKALKVSRSPTIKSAIGD